MAAATFIKTSLVDSTSSVHSQAIVEVDGVETTVNFWFDLIEQWGKEGVKQYVCAEALKQTGNLVDAIDILKPDATGKVTLDKDEKVSSDTRSWQKKWIDENPIVPAPSAPEVDPLA
jgi:hypothetical protein